MSRKRRHKRPTTAIAPMTTPAHVADAGNMVLEFGEPESVITDTFADYLGVFLDQGEYYSPPVSKRGLVQLLRANAYHGRMPSYRAGQVLRYTETNSTLPRQELEKLVLDYLVTGELYAGLTYNAIGKVIGVGNLLSAYARVRPSSSKPRYAYLQPGGLETVDYDEDEVVHITQPDLLQGIYGLPAYFGALHSVLLNEAATLFRRKYYRNGAHIGSVFVTTAASLKPADEKAIASKIKASKGIGNFRSMYLHLPGNQKAQDVINIIPVGDVATRDEFAKIKEWTQSDISAAWGTRPEVAGIMPETNGSTGDIEKLVEIDYWNNTFPILQKLEVFNDYLPAGKKLVFKDFYRKTIRE